jgi:integrase
MQLGQIRPDHVRRVLAKMAEANLSATTIACTRDTLATVPERAVKDRVLPHNPVSAVDSVQRGKPRRYTLTTDQASAFLHAAEGDPLEALFVVTLHTGLRESEVLGLHWKDVNLDRGELTVRRALSRVKGHGLQTNDPKTEASAAVVPLTPRAVAALRAHRERVMAEHRLPAGYVFSIGNGTPISASNMLRSNFYPIWERAGIPTRASSGLRFHDLRHSAGSLMVQAGVRPKDVQAILRHSKVSTTMDLYVHSYDEDLRAAVGKLGAAIG